MKTVESAKGRLLRQRLVIAVSLFGLSGCVSAVTDDEMAGTTKKPEISTQQKPQTAASAAAAGAQPGHYVDPAVASAAGAAAPVQPQAAGGPAQAAHRGSPRRVAAPRAGVPMPGMMVVWWRAVFHPHPPKGSAHRCQLRRRGTPCRAWYSTNRPCADARQNERRWNELRA